MLSNPKCTNQTGTNQRQQSAPSEFKSNSNFILQVPEDSETSAYRVPGSQDIEARYPQNEVRQNSNNNNGVDEQHNQRTLQISQELNARPGSEDHNAVFQQELPTYEPSKVAFADRPTLSEADVDALLKGLESNEACFNQSLPQLNGHSRQNSGFAVNFSDQEDDAHFTSFVINRRMGEADSQPTGSTCMKSKAPRRHVGVVEDRLYTDNMELSDENVEKLTRTDNGSSFGQSGLLSTPGAGSSLVKEDSNSTIKASKRTSNAGHSRGSSIVERYFDVGKAPLQQAMRASRHSVDFASPSLRDFPDLSDLKADMPLGKGGYNPALYSPLNNSLPSNMASLQSSPEVPSMTLFEDAEVDNIVIDAQRSYMQATQCSVDLSAPASPVRQTYHERTQSTTDLDLEDCVRDTGVTTEEIASFIQGPLPDDQKWSCLFEETCGRPCGKRFARKENAKSHVQTHLGDRQFVCRVCQTPFVRQHDLKRHFKIHTVEKAHRCPCGKDFHRHDALTRHRQRGMCVGAFGGTPKKVIKRGRPKKARPSTEERSEKAAKTRQYVMERTRPGSTYASSISGSSEYSAPSPQDFDNLSVTASSPSLSHKNFDDFKFPEMHAQPLTPPTSPDRITEMLCLPPSVYQTQSPESTRHSLSPKLCSIQEISESSMLACASHQQFQSSPPELDLSSSSPANSQIFDFSNYSEAAGSQDQYMKGFDPLRPHMFSHDFQLFNPVNRETEGAVKFEDFLDFSNIDSTSSDKQNLKIRSGMVDLNQHSPYEESANQLDNAFTQF